MQLTQTGEKKKHGVSPSSQFPISTPSPLETKYAEPPSRLSGNANLPSPWSISFSGVRIQHVCHVANAQMARRPGSVAMMAEMEELKEIMAKTTEEVNDEVIGLKGELFMLRL